MSALEVRDPRLYDVVVDEPPRRAATGFRFLEGPVWHPRERSLVFSDIPAGRMYRRSADGQLSVFRDPSNMANGNAYDRRGRLLTCEHATSRLVRQEPGSRPVTLADRYNGRELNSPNDVVVARDGTIFFTDSAYCRTRPYGVPRPRELPFCGVYRLDAHGLELLTDEVEGPNGLCLSLDEQHLFVADTERMHIRRFELTDRGVGAGPGWVRTTGTGPGEPDGLKIDSAGNLFSCGPGGIHVFDAAGSALGVIRVPEVTANFTWGDDDMRTLYVCAGSTLHRFRTRVPGTRAF
ncbi:SMP-30/gluconolactonase/LRE family protein [Pseudonocardia sp. KRD291]|uniref:SMP-30/gluconolactonase/LRE family protein n=1 Tax=Pseudonocardia sp. KRD291 TaxID=2792007 RepID=UPI001C49DE51|nr:SMP-30/gluconolactonase/LRE family protein [Pseudonocardia sp. KRD291]MBW0100893.1 SMP-30/gluconolactonase/LRE family protein [Pseudonocardia sp. KRD291]